MKERVLRIFSHLAVQPDAIVLMNDTEPLIDLSFFYATGVESGLFEGCAAIIWPDGGVDLLTSQLEETSARHSTAEVKPFRRIAERDQMLREALQGARSIGINGQGITYRHAMVLRDCAPKASLVDIGKELEAARMVKDERELENLREAGRIASRVADEIPYFLREGMAEHEASAELNYRMQKRGASSPAFETIAAFGPSSAEPHYSSGNRSLRSGEAALFDFGARYRMYCSDITRTYFVGHIPAKFERMYEVVLDAQEAALRALRAGVNGKDVDAAARAVIDASEFKDRLIHSLGHGLGLSVHDGGSMAPAQDLELKENMVLTVEPGVYIPGEGGVRIEDDVRVTSSGYELLTSAKRELTVI